MYFAEMIPKRTNSLVGTVGIGFELQSLFFQFVFDPFQLGLFACHGGPLLRELCSFLGHRQTFLP